MIATEVLRVLLFATVVVGARYALARLTGDPADSASANKTLGYPAVAVLLVGASASWVGTTGAGEGWIPSPALLANLVAWLLVGSAGMAILLWTSARALKIWRSPSEIPLARTLALWLLMLLPAIVIIVAFAASGLTWA